MRGLARVWLTLGMTLLAGLRVVAGEFMVGADMSHLVFFEDRGITYRDNGQVGEALELLRDRGLNCVRLRLFTSSAAQAQANPYNYTNNLSYTLPLAIRAKNAGLQVLLDFHYSDTWADPGHQSKPAAWSNLSFNDLVLQMRTYNSNAIASFQAAGVLPDYVQVGNEITGGMLWPDGANTNATQWSKLAQLMSAAVQGIQDAAGTNMPKIIVHIDRGGDWNTTKWFFDNLTQRSVPFDIIGQSYYPWWHGTLTALENCLSNTAVRYSKPVLLAETAFPWTNFTNIFGIPASTNGQIEFVSELARIVKGLPNQRGAGIIWWGTEYQRVNGVNTASFEYKSFFGTGGNILPVAVAFGKLAAPPLLSARLSGNAFSLHWPLSGAGMGLRVSSDALLIDDWLPVTNPIQSSGGVFSTTLPLDAGSRFFRLQPD
jgi:arabinogalactan endo-1,4-beta-galactosidase